MNLQKNLVSITNLATEHLHLSFSEIQADY